MAAVWWLLTQCWWVYKLTSSNRGLNSVFILFLWCYTRISVTYKIFLKHLGLLENDVMYISEQSPIWNHFLGHLLGSKTSDIIVLVMMFTWNPIILDQSIKSSLYLLSPRLSAFAQDATFIPNLTNCRRIFWSCKIRNLLQQ